MIPAIQHDESLHSYIHRVLYLDSMSPASAKLRGVLAFNVDSRAKAAASLMTWPGCYGFNRVLHSHTWYPVFGIFNNGYDRSYSQRRYSPRANCSDIGKKEHAYCPECVKEDFVNLGFPYWRRSHNGDVTVCAKHNVLLVASCHSCGVPFTTTSNNRGHGLEVMWSGCSGKQITEVAVEFNKNPTALKEAKFYSDALDYGYLIPLEATIRLLQRRFKYLKASGKIFTSVVEDGFRAQRLLIDKLDLIQPGHERSFSYDGDRLIKAAIAVYEDFKEFVNDVQFGNNDLRPVQSLWTTYISGGYESIQYIEEDYSSGVGIWSCPYPSIRSLDPSSRDSAKAQRSLKYPCCNPDSLESSGLSASVKAKAAVPKIPILKRFLEEQKTATANL
ncbi:TniQ family protein [Pseudomonas bohemica]|uniref:TniQ family protein n=1 Tax=Pseudomonas bohemica TaxID=2044872 RepID=UPI0018FF005F|nr:TniQ family protein [Pseudomonas bohemica]